MDTEKHGWDSPDRKRILADDKVTLVPLDVAKHGEALWRAASPEANGGEDIFRYLWGSGPFTTAVEFQTYLERKAAAPHELTYTVVRALGDEIVGSVSLLNIRSEHGAVEAGSIWYTKKVQRTEVNTHSLWLLMNYVFGDLGYRRFEWKCNNANEASKAAALRLGFQYEGLFRQHGWVKGANRDTAWYSIIDGEWPDVKRRFAEKLLRS